MVLDKGSPFAVGRNVAARTISLFLLLLFFRFGLFLRWGIPWKSLGGDLGQFFGLSRPLEVASLGSEQDEVAVRVEVQFFPRSALESASASR